MSDGLNDFFDAEVDAVERPERPIPSGRISRSTAGCVGWSLLAAGVLAAWFVYLKQPELAGRLRERAGALYTLLVNKYYFDAFNEKVLAAAARGIAQALWRGGDVAVIDGAAVNGSARLVSWAAGRLRALQSGYLYHYAFATIIGLSALLAWLLWR